MDNNLVTNLNDFVANEKGKLSYPYLFIDTTSDALSVTLEALEPGNLPVLIVYNKVLMQVASISDNIYNLCNLLSVFEFKIVLEKDREYLIKKEIDLLEMGEW